jgi:hypothetical protein
MSEPVVLPLVIPDTNYLLDFPDLMGTPWHLRPLEILISQMVIDELRGLCHHSDAQTARKAHEAVAALDRLNNAFAKVAAPAEVSITFGARLDRIAPPLEQDKTDHQLIGLAKHHHGTPPTRFCVLLTRDRELRDIAEAMSVLVVVPDREGLRYHSELKRKYEWWQKVHRTDPAQSLKPATAREKGSAPSVEGKRIGKQLDAQTRLDRFVRQLYSRVRANDHRAILAVAPLPARVNLAIQILQRVPRPEKRVVIVVVGSQAAARYWAKEVRIKCELPPSVVPIFGFDDQERLEESRAVVYRHDQIARRLPQHVARLRQAGRHLTAVVDGCDVLDPVDLAHLLFTCDQFIGFSHYPLGYAEAPGSRMLSTFLHGHALLTYSFADAERDGWGHAFDPYRHPVEFAPDEREQWDEANAEYLRLRDLALREHPELRQAADFWPAVYDILHKTASPEIATLIPLRETREQIAHLSRNKVSVVCDLIAHTSHQPYRRLIFDYNRTWTPVLLKQCAGAGAAATELPESTDEQLAAWDKFAGGKLDTLMLSKPPALDLPGAHFHQLIVLTPLRPMAEISEMVDWALNHTQAKDALRIDLLYIEGTPEELAMLELAEASFGLRYERKA